MEILIALESAVFVLLPLFVWELYGWFDGKRPAP